MVAVALGAAAGAVWAPVAVALVERWPERVAPSLRPRRAWRRWCLVPACVLVGAGMAALGGASAAGVGAVVLGLVLVPVVLIDIEHLLIPDVLVLPATALAAIVSAAADPGRWWVPIAWGLGAGGLLGVMSIVSPRGIGLGDAKLCLLLGVTLGAAVIHALVVAFALGGLVGVVLLARHGASARTMALPFGPFLAVGALVALAWDPSQPPWP